MFRQCVVRRYSTVVSLGSEASLCIAQVLPLWSAALLDDTRSLDARRSTKQCASDQHHAEWSATNATTWQE